MSSETSDPFGASAGDESLGSGAPDAGAAPRRRVPVRALLRAAGRGVTHALFALGVLTIVIVTIAAAAGYRPVVLTSGSMGDTAPTGSLIVARPTQAVDVGDVLVMRGEGRATVTHRVVSLGEGEGAGASGKFAITRGDGNTSDDPLPYPIAETELVAAYVVPGFGEVLLELRKPGVGLTLMAFVLGGLVLIALRRIWFPPAPVAPSAETALSPTDRPEQPLEAATRRPDRQSERWPRRPIGVATALGVIAATTGVVMSVYTATDVVSANTFTTGDCFDARLQGVQQGQVTNNTNGLSTVSISSVDPARSFLLYTASSNAGTPDDSMLIGRLLDATTVQFEREADGTPGDIVIEWSVVEFACGVSVQRGTATGNGAATLDVAISSVDPAASFATANMTAPSGASQYNNDDHVSVRIHDATTLRFEGDPLVGSGRPIAWQVITYDNGTDIAVETVTATIGAASTSATAALSGPVDPSSTLVLASYRTPNTGAAVGDRSIRAYLSDPSTITVARDLSSGSVTAVVQVITFNDGTTVTGGQLTMAPAQTTATATILPVTLLRSTPLGSSVAPTGHSGGSTAKADDDVAGEGSARMRMLSSTSVELVRGASTAAATFNWQVVTWGGPAWADLSSPFRQRIAIDAGTVDAPLGYTVPLVIDHATMVSEGLSLSDGSDLRIWRHDGANWTELDRVLDDGSSFNSPSTTLLFRTNDAITAQTTASYWLYFGDATPDAVLNDPSNVFLVVEGFESGTLGAFQDRTGGGIWYEADEWTTRIQLTIPAGLVASDVTDARMLVRLTDAQVAATAQADGSDIRFTAADGTTPLPHDLEAFDSGTGTVTAWVRVPSVSAASPTMLWLYAGASNAPDQSDARTTWDGVEAVWHFAADPGAPGPGLQDSASAGRDGVAVADATLIDTASGPAIGLDGTLDRLEAPPLRLADAGFTVAAWVRADTLIGERVLVSQGDPSNGGAFELVIDASGSPTLATTVRTPTGPVTVSGGTVSPSTWHLSVVTFDGSNVRLYLDGVEVGSAAISGLRVDGPQIVSLGAEVVGANALHGAIGEVWIDDAPWSEDRIDLLTASLANPASTVAAGAPATSSWFPQGSWAVRRQIIVDRALVDVTLSDFPLLVQVSDAALAASAEADGRDFVFTATDGVTRLDHQIENWNPGTGELTAWVRVPSLDPGVDTRLYVYLDNASAVDQQDPAGVWGDDAVAVFND